MNGSPETREILAAVLLGLAVIHTFATSAFNRLANRFREGSVAENLFHLLGEVEVVFGFWAGILFLAILVTQGRTEAFGYAEGLNFTEALFVFAIMAVAATRPIQDLATRMILLASRLFPGRRRAGELPVYFCCLFLGPLLGSLITEPAAMTVIALILKDRFFDRAASDRLRYITLAILFVNVSIGGAITPYAAPPVLMVASKWNWGLAEMVTLYGWKVIAACAINAGIGAFLLRKELRSRKSPASLPPPAPLWLIVLHLLAMASIVLSSHHPVVFLGVLLFFLGIVSISREHQNELKLRESLLVGFFLAGLIMLGGLQSWWLDPILHRLDALPLFLGTTALTAITDNAALTFLGSQVENATHSYRYALLAGAIAGGGLTVIANAPNPAGYSILQESFGEDGINPFRLFVAALVPTVVAMACLWLLG